MGGAESSCSQNAKPKNKNIEPVKIGVASTSTLASTSKSSNKENDDSDTEEFIDCTSEFDYEDFRAFDNNNTEVKSEEIKEIKNSLNVSEENANERRINEDDVRDCVDIVKLASHENHNINRKNVKQSSESFEESDEEADRKEQQKKEMEEFHAEMTKKRELRQKCLQNLRDELKTLREQLTIEKEVNQQLKETIDLNNDAKHMDNLYNENIKLKSEIANLQMNLQTSNSENLSLNSSVFELKEQSRHLKETVANENIRLKTEVEDLQTNLQTKKSENVNLTAEVKALREQTKSLKEVVSAIKEMLAIREDQVEKLKEKLKEIEEAFVEKEMKIMSSALQQEYQKQLDNIRRMRELYEERANLLATERDEYKEKLRDCEHDLKSEVEKVKNLEDYVGVLENNLKVKGTDICMLESEIGILKSEKAQTQSEMNAINQLISQILLGFNANGNNLDIDKLVNMLEENRDLLNEMAIKEEFTGIEEGAFLPKLLYDLFLQVNGESASEEKTDETQETKEPITVEQVAEKLPKVWRVLIELLSHHRKLNEIQLNDDEKELDDCYKSIQTASGPQAVLSVSKTFVKLKDLILEKKSLQKDTTRLKTLYSHLEHRLDKQEKRLSAVSLELTKTWHLVGKIKRQHRQLHTHEQILCYQLQQKRKLLNELKEELEYCRKKWAMAREKNDESEIQCKLMRQEFTRRKLQDNNSAESGYSDEHPSDGSEDEGIPCAGPSNLSMKREDLTKFDENLGLFERTMSPTNSERRRSESPLPSELPDLCIYSRAQSEPPASAYLLEIYNNVTEEIQIPQSISECDNGNIHPNNHDIEERHNTVVVTQPPPVLVNVQKSQPKAQLSSSKSNKSKKTKVEKKKQGKQESAEHMFMRLSGYIVTGTISESDEECSDISEKEVVEDTESSEIKQEEVTKPESPTENLHLEDLIGAVCQELMSENKNSTKKTEISNYNPIEIELPENDETCIDDVMGAVCLELMTETKPTEPAQESKSETPTTNPQKTEEKENLSVLTTTEQEYLARRAARLARLEAEAQAFYDKLSKTKERGQKMSSQIDDIHNSFVERERQKEKLNKTEEEKKKIEKEKEESVETKEKEKSDKTEEEQKIESAKEQSVGIDEEQENASKITETANEKGTEEEPEEKQENTNKEELENETEQEKETNEENSDKKDEETDKGSK